ncbi:MAG: pseudouridine synthase [Bacteroidia bacterium]|nr:pseudouridine synthase [Bacteroidia bacterium]
MNSGYTYTDIVPPAFAGDTVLDYYAKRYRHSSREEWLERIREGRVLLDARVAQADQRLAAGDRLQYTRKAWDEPAAPAELTVIASGEGWMVFHKPEGLPVLPGAGFLEHTLLHTARAAFGDNLAPVHRLGRGTTGAILFSTDSSAAATLARAMRERRIRKTYLALASGLPSDDAFTVDVPIGPVPHALLGTVYAANPQGKPSVSHCRIIRRDAAAGCSLIEVRIPTGRPHQIRIHLAAAGFPLAGDPLYTIGGLPQLPDDVRRQAVPGDCGYLLHSWKIRFPEPSSESETEIIAEPPPALR